jgi:leucyl aminopeptidase
METPQIAVSRPSKTPSTKTLQCQILPLKALVKSAFSAKWPKTAKLRLNERLKESKKKLEDDTQDVTIQLHFEAGGEWIGLFISDDIKTFALHTALRRAFESSLKKNEGEKIFLDISGLSEDLQTKTLSGFVGLSRLLTWAPNKYGKNSKDKTKPVARVDVHTTLSPAIVKEISKEALLLAESNSLVRTLGNMPSNLLTPATYLEEIKSRAKAGKYKVEFLDRKALTKMGAGAFLAVTQGSLDDPGGIVHLHVPARQKKKKLVLVGKGLCFDTGGYNIKTGAYMYGMHKDMLGSAIALGLFETIIKLNLDIEVHAYLALAENLISHKAYRPNDVVTALDGTTIEVLDTDAEGRMVLSDTLALARKQKPDLVIDFATLTGSAVKSLDTRRGAVFANRDELLRLGYEAGEESGERAWAFPIGEDYKDGLKSDIADVLQCATVHNADHIYAATFLSRFVGDETPWLHMDLCCYNNKGGLGLVSSETTGYGVRWGLEVVKRYFRNDTVQPEK